MTNPALTVINAYDTWTNSLADRIGEVVDAYRHLDFVTAQLRADGTLADDQPPGSDYDIADRRVHAALAAVPFWLRWIFA